MRSSLITSTRNGTNTCLSVLVEQANKTGFCYRWLLRDAGVGHGAYGAQTTSALHQNGWCFSWRMSCDALMLVGENSKARRPSRVQNKTRGR